MNYTKNEDERQDVFEYGNNFENGFVSRGGFMSNLGVFLDVEMNLNIVTPRLIVNRKIV